MSWETVVLVFGLWSMATCFILGLVWRELRSKGNECD